jgi:molybdopterin-guanine dinucleotide biosynthesis protein A
LLHHAVTRVAELTRHVVVVLSPHAPEPDLPIEVAFARDPTEGEGPLAGLHAGLLAAAGADVVVVAAGDMPDLVPAVLKTMIGLARDSGAEAVALNHGERLVPLPCVLRAAPAVDTAHFLLHAGRRSLLDLLHALGTTVLEDEAWRALDPQGLTLRDVDRPEDLERP